MAFQLGTATESVQLLHLVDSCFQLLRLAVYLESQTLLRPVEPPLESSCRLDSR